MALFPISDIITWAKISQYLGRFYVSQNNLFKGGDNDPNYPQLIRMERRGLEFMYRFNPNDPNIDAVANYVYGLTKYIAQAKVIAGQGGSGAIVNPTTGAATSLTGVFVQFKIGDPGALMIVGQTVLVLSYNDPIGGTVSVDLDGIELPQNDSLQVSYTVVYSTTGVTITFNQGALDQQVYQIRFLRFIPIT